MMLHELQNCYMKQFVGVLSREKYENVIVAMENPLPSNQSLSVTFITCTEFLVISKTIDPNYIDEEINR